MGRNIQHIGIVESIEGSRVRVVVPQQSACSGCHAQGFCGEKGKERIIEINTPHASSFEVGERVIVALLNKDMALSSVLWAYILPLIVMMAALVMFKFVGLADGPSALLAIAAVAVYYVGLYLFRTKIDKKIQFTIFKE